MTIGLTVLLGVLSLGILAGRIYEILKLTDAATGFFIYKGVVFNPYILIIFAVITICCAIIIFGEDKNIKPFFSDSSKLIAAASGVMFVIYGVMSLMAGTVSAVFVLAGGAALIITGICGLDSKMNAPNIAVIVLTVAFIAGLCIDVIVINVSTIYNVEFMKNALAYLSAGMFLIFMMKNIFYPAKYSRMLLYITGVISFVMCGIMNIADIIAMVVNGQAVLPDLFFNAGFGFLGFFAFDNAISAMPKKAVSENALENVTEKEESAQTEYAEPSEPEPVCEALPEIPQEYSDDMPKQETAEVQLPQADFYETEIRESKNAYVQNAEQQEVKKVVFTAKTGVKEKAQQKDNGKVVYKRPK